MQNLRFVFISLLSFSQLLQLLNLLLQVQYLTPPPVNPYQMHPFLPEYYPGYRDPKNGEFSLSLKSGGYDLIFSYTGYQTQTIRISDNNKLEILLVKEDKSLGEVVLKSSFEVADGWEKYGDFLLRILLVLLPMHQNVSLPIQRF